MPRTVDGVNTTEGHNLMYQPAPSPLLLHTLRDRITRILDRLFGRRYGTDPTDFDQDPWLIPPTKKD